MRNYRAQYIKGLATALSVLYRLYRSLYTFDFFLMRIYSGSDYTPLSRRLRA